MGRKLDVASLFSDLSWALAESDARTSSKISSNRGIHQGKMVGFKITINATTDNITFTLKVKDEDGDVIYTSGAISDDGTTVTMGLAVPLYAEETLVLTPSAAPGASTGIVSNISLYYEPDARL